MQQRFYVHMISVFRTVIPRPEDRIPLNTDTWPHLFSPMLPILFMAYLVRKPNTHILRILLLPIVFFTSLRAGFSYVWLDLRYNIYNFGRGLISLTFIARALEYTFAADGIRKVDKCVPKERQCATIATALSSTPDALDNRSLKVIIPTPLADAVEVLCSMRGIGFEYGQGVTIPPETRPLQKGPFLKATFRTFLLSFLLVDSIEATMKRTPPLRTPMGGSIFISSEPWPRRYLFSTAFHFATGLFILAAVEMFYSFFTIFSIVFLHHSPAAWPPVINKPWVAQSLHEFWAERWHQVVRQTFMIYGGYPGRWISERLGLDGRLGLLFGTFIGSGLWHELACYAMGRGLDWRVPAFFIMNAFFILGERIWKAITGHRVSGWQGTVWTYVAVVVLGQNISDAWHQRGLGGTWVIPPVLSPTQRILFPVLDYLMARLYVTLEKFPTFVGTAFFGVYQ